MSYTLPDLSYDYSALEPAISGGIMEIHHAKHHKTYIAKFNEALEKYAEAEKKNDIESMICYQDALKFNGGGHINHTMFWENLAPQNAGGGEKPTGELATQINYLFGSFEAFVKSFNEKTAAIQGSGWGWLGYSKAFKTIQIQTTSNQDLLEAKTGLVPLLGIDIWEHAYYLQYKNVRPDYLKAIWQVVNWTNVEERLKKAMA